MEYLTTHTSPSPIRRGFAPVFVDYKQECTRLATASDKVYQLLAHGRWFSLGTPAFSTTRTGRHDIAEILLKVALNTINQIKSSFMVKVFVCKLSVFVISLYFLGNLVFFFLKSYDQKQDWWYNGWHARLESGRSDHGSGTMLSF